MRQSIAVLCFGMACFVSLSSEVRAQHAASGALQLRADSANTREVVLSWSAAAGKQWRVERKSGQEVWAAIATVSEGKATDSKIAPYGTYNYRVVSGTTTSNVITVGPPPGGFHTISPRPDKHPDTAFGKLISPALDSNGDPAAAFVYADPNGDGKSEDTQLMFVSWDRATYRWKEPVFIATAPNFDPRVPVPGVSLARDAQTGIYGVTWVESDSKTLRLARSKDGGATWDVVVALTDAKALAGPTLGFSGGKAHLAVQMEGRNAIRYMTGSVEEDPGAWKSSFAPMLPGNTAVLRAASLALDGKGEPAVAYWQRANNLWTLTYWRPGSAQPVKVTDTSASTYPPDGVLLAFRGTQPSIILDSRLDKAQISSHYSVYSRDGGATWSQPVAIPDDGNEHIGGYMSFAVAEDQRAAFAGDVAGGNTDRMQCSWPKLARTTDFAAWTTCAPQGAQYKDIRTLWGSVIYSPSGLLYMMFQNRATNPAQGLPAGLLIWGGK